MTVVPGSFPCERALGAGDASVFTSDVFYCVDCYDHVSALQPAVTGSARRVRLLRGLTCGGGAAQD
jgi:hypothetical protein